MAMWPCVIWLTGPLPPGVVGEAVSQAPEMERLGKPPETQYRHLQSIASRGITTMNVERLSANPNRERSPAKLMGFGSGVFLQTRWASKASQNG